MVKNKEKKLILISITFILIVIVGFIFQQQISQSGYSSETRYDNQCGLPSCPSGYSEVHTYCDGLRCYKDCEKIIDAHCGDNWGSLDSNKKTEKIEGKSNFLEVYSDSESTDKCYKYYAEGRVGVDDWNLALYCSTADSFNVHLQSPGTVKSSCSNDWYEGISSDNWKETGRGSSWGKEVAQLDVTAYKSSGCSNEFSSSDCGILDNEAEVEIKWKTADWIPEQTKTETVSCSFECAYDRDCPEGETYTECDEYELIEISESYYCKDYDCEPTQDEQSLGVKLGECGVECKSNSDCPEDQFEGDKYCKNGNVVQDYKEYSCSEGYRCGSTSKPEIVEECDNGCEDGKCLGVDKPSKPEVAISNFFNNIWNWIKNKFS